MIISEKIIDELDRIDKWIIESMAHFKNGLPSDTLERLIEVRAYFKNIREAIEVQFTHSFAKWSTHTPTRPGVYILYDKNDNHFDLYRFAIDSKGHLMEDDKHDIRKWIAWQYDEEYRSLLLSKNIDVGLPPNTFYIGEEYRMTPEEINKAIERVEEKKILLWYGPIHEPAYSGRQLGYLKTEKNAYVFKVMGDVFKFADTQKREECQSFTEEEAKPILANHPELFWEPITGKIEALLKAVDRIEEKLS